jgi:hypothetical protein
LFQAKASGCFAGQTKTSLALPIRAETLLLALPANELFSVLLLLHLWGECGGAPAKEGKKLSLKPNDLKTPVEAHILKERLCVRVARLNEPDVSEVLIVVCSIKCDESLNK